MNYKCLNSFSLFNYKKQNDLSVYNLDSRTINMNSTWI